MALDSVYDFVLFRDFEMKLNEDFNFDSPNNEAPSTIFFKKKPRLFYYYVPQQTVSVEWISCINCVSFFTWKWVLIAIILYTSFITLLPNVNFIIYLFINIKILKNHVNHKKLKNIRSIEHRFQRHMITIWIWMSLHLKTSRINIIIWN